MKIAVFGLGYVGTVSAACLADMGHEVIGLDVNPIKVEIINHKKSPIIEKDISELVEQMVSQGRLHATTEIEKALLGVNLVYICVGTPNEDDGSLSTQAIVRTCESIAASMSLMAEYPVIILRSTVMPGTTEDLVIPTLERISNKKAGVDFGVCFNPEFLREGTSIFDFYNPPQTVIGTRDDRTNQVVSGIYQPLQAPLVKTEIKVAEMIKIVCNVYHALKITFANEIGNVCKQYGIDSHHVMDIFCNDKKLNISPAYLKPGYAFGGSCLPKDIHGLLYLARQTNVELPVIESILPSNELQIRTAMNMIIKTGKKKIGFLGLSFKEGTDDLRSSAQVELIERLIGKGFDICVYDQNVSIARLIGANKAYIEKEIPHISTLMTNSIQKVLETCDVIVVANKEKAFEKVVEMVKPNQMIIDLVRISQDVELQGGVYSGLSW